MAKQVLATRSVLRRTLGGPGVEFIEHVAGAFERILPHVEVAGWREGPGTPPGSVWESSSRTGIRVTISFGDIEDEGSRSLTATVRRRGSISKTLDQREFDICRGILERLGDIAEELDERPLTGLSPETMEALRSSFDESVIAQHIQDDFDLEMPVGPIFVALRRLSEQTYENKAMVFGCLLGSSPLSGVPIGQFPDPLLRSKRYKALSDGFRTAYLISTNGQIADFVDLETFTKKKLTATHHYPDWAASLAQSSLRGGCAIALTRQGDVLAFDSGTLRFTYRFGEWRYWNHAHVLALLSHQARAQNVAKDIRSKVVRAIYHAALDISFRRSGALFVVLHSRHALHDIVREGDAIGDSRRSLIDEDFDQIVCQRKIQDMPRSILVELASLDGAVVLANSGEILAYGAVLQPRKAGKIRGAEGSRTKAAIGASNYGLAIKISSDGDLTAYSKGDEFFRV